MCHIVPVKYLLTVTSIFINEILMFYNFSVWAEPGASSRVVLIFLGDGLPKLYSTFAPAIA